MSLKQTVLIFAQFLKYFKVVLDDNMGKIIFK